MRHIEKAVDAYGVLVELVWATLSGLPPGALNDWLDTLSGDVEAGKFPLNGTDRTVLRFELDVMVALDVLDAPAEELAHWAFQAITGARRVEALRRIEALPPTIGSSGLRGELARIRSRMSWLSWDAAEVAKPGFRSMPCHPTERNRR